MMDKVLLKLSLEALQSMLRVVFDISMLTTDSFWQDDPLMMHLAETNQKVKEKLESLSEVKE